MSDFDKQLCFSDAQALTATAYSTNIIDFGARGTPKHGAAALGRDMGNNDNLFLEISVDVTMVSGGSSTLDITLEQDDDAAFGSAETIFTCAQIAKASLVAGYVVPDLTRLPKGLTKRYARLKYTVGTANFTAGAISAAIRASRQSNT